MRLQGGAVIENATCDNRPSGPTQKKGGGEGSIVAPIDKKNLSFAVQILFFLPEVQERLLGVKLKQGGARSGWEASRQIVR